MDRIIKIRQEAEELGQYLNVPVTLGPNCNWIIVPNFNLPSGFIPPNAPALLKLIDYPDTPPGIDPNKLYLGLALLYNDRNPLFYRYGESDLSEKDWHHRCFISIDWNRDTDTLITFFQMLTLALQEER